MRRRALGVLVGLALLIPAPVPATHGSGGCGSPTDSSGNARWLTARSRWCTFDIRGLPVTVWGEARDPVGSRQVSLRVFVTFAEEHDLSRTTGHDPYVVVECTASGAGFATCEDDVSVGEVVDTQRGFLGRLRCNVEATPSGSWTPQFVYWCSVGSGIG
ncbi:MAG TPA: hypothetical protein VGB52_11085 [Actinomycetota bacterium]